MTAEEEPADAQQPLLNNADNHRKAQDYILLLERQLMKSREQVAQLVNELFMMEKEANER